MSQRKTYSAEFKPQAVELVRSSSISTSAVARDLGLSRTLLNRLCREGRRSSKPGFQGRATPRNQELARLKRELTQVKNER